ncbi:leucine-rich repeat serine/threonine-protein kinase 1 isoform X1 [Triplophysa rosa]|uniref:non-specific serine/threonine protein kinase n=2 Tax=Triplophysa rosa TaxID=992332 RepID=A0A9W7X548_TRIRA|nr:leucine-rich repeat serine/threonine-protein kinase 1 isoform X1 [Triplophysa rosa]KAI7813751.1 putative leucine-rich repeat serine/threonine-protein kinase 1 [Triplophysa rosa]
MSYWNVCTSTHPEGTSSRMDQQDDILEMGAKQSAVGSVPLSQSPTLKNIQEAYTDGEDQRARELIRLSCENNSASRPDGLELLSVATQNGDAESVRFLLKDARVSVPQEPAEGNPAVLAAHYGHQMVVRELLDSIPRPCVRKELLNWMLATACQRGHMEVVKMLVESYNADADDCAVHSGEFAIITGLPLYAAARAGNKEIACFLLRNGAGFSSYTLMDHREFCRQLLRERHLQDRDTPADDRLQQALHVNWSCLKLPWLDLDWFMDVSSRITVLDLSHNCLTSLPSVVPWGLINLRSLDLSHNLLRELPTPTSSQEIICSRLDHVNLCENELECLPAGLLHLGHIQRISAAKNKLKSLFNIPNGTNWIGLRKLQELDLSDNMLTDVPSSVLHCLKSLNSLNVSRNKLSGFPDPWACPLKICKASNNQMETLPDTISIFWRTHLKEVDFSENSLKELPSYIFELEVIVCLKLCGNQISTLPAPNKWKCSHLRTLDLSRNRLGKTDEPAKTRKLAFFTTWHRRDPEPVCPIQFPVILRDSLEVLFLNDNQLECVPPSVYALKNLSELYLSNNPGIQELPIELGQLSNLWQLDIEDLNITNVPADVRKDGPSAVLAYLRAELRGAEPCRLLKIMVVGPPRQGKSALLESLQTGKQSPFLNTDCSIHTSAWELERPSGVKSAIDSVFFNVWDIGGPASMSTVNQCFFTDKSLYVVIWNLALGEEAVANLQSWLLNIEARAPNSAVVVIGTHLDLIDTKFRMERIATLRAYILALCRTPSGSRASGYPDITWKQLHEVSCKTLEGMDCLKRLLFHIACSMKDISNPASCHKLVGRLIPKSYLKLQEAVIVERERRDAMDEVQYLTDLELEQIIEQTPDSDIKDYEDLQTAISFLIETGTILHFPDTSHGLCKLYFLDAVWLSECLERIINLKGSRSVARNGVINAKDLRLLLVGTGFTQQTEEQYFQFLTKFEIALPVASNSYLLPHLLPPKPAMDIHGFRQQSNNSIQRHFKMSFVPAGFWERFIARMLISLNQMDLQAFETKKNTKNHSNRNTVIYSFAGNQQRNRCSTFRVRRSQTIYWKEGLLVTFDGGYLSVESSDLNWKKKKSGGIKIMCQSDTRDFSAMAFITDHVNALIEQWFPALTASESDGSLLIEQYAPCPYCSSVPKIPDAHAASHHNTVHYFNMEDCVLAAVDKEHITCPNHPKQPVPLQELVPELFMTDFPSRLFLLKDDLVWTEQEADILGQGGSGTIVYRASYRGHPVAIKRFHFKKCKQLSLNSGTDTMVKHLQSMDAARSFSEFRLEASMLHSLQHPCIVALVGISIHPLCFALQLAPLGSLNTILEERAKGSQYVPLGHMVTFKVAYQIAAGLAYLHRKNIIFCDLKSDNILVWSLDVEDSVNIKLSDYGISRQSFHEGALGVEGTPGYQAPEIRPGIVYDEKVDMFSYGMVLYELLSGRRPCMGQHLLQIAKKLSKGVRPALGGPEEVQFHCLQSLMQDCWDTKPEKRPLAAPLLRHMHDPSFACLRYLLPCQEHSQLFLSPLQGHSAVFWDGDNDSRNYTVVNLATGQVEVKRMLCPGSRLSCQLKMDNSLWTATEEQEVFIYSLKEMCPLSLPQKVLSCPAVVTCLFLLPARKETLPQVYAGMSDGLVVVYSLVDDMPVEGETYICSHTVNKHLLGMDDSDPRQRPYPVRSIVPVRTGSELWYTNGPGILVINSLTLHPVCRLDPYLPPSSVISMATSISCWGDEVIWCLDDHTNSLLMYHTASYQLCATYNCSDANPLRDIFPVQRPTGVVTSVTTSEDIEEPLPTNQELVTITVTHSDGAGTQILCQQDSLDYCSMTSSGFSSEQLDQIGDLEQAGACLPHIERSSSGPLSSLTSSGSIPLSTDFEETELASVESSPSRSAADPELSAQNIPPQLKALNIIAVNGSIWIPRRGGDIMVIEVQEQSGSLRGRVIAVLTVSGAVEYGALAEAALVAKDTVVCGFRNENMAWCLAVWRSWGGRELELFYRGYEDLGRLESSLRKRR